MNLWNKVKLMWKGRSIAEHLLQIKSRWKEPTFWVALLSNAVTGWALLSQHVNAGNAPWIIIGNAVLTSAYNYVRGLQKAESDGVKPFSTSSEFYIGLAGMANNALLSMQTGGFEAKWIVPATLLMGHAITASRDLANMRPKEVVAAGVPVTADVAPGK